MTSTNGRTIEKSLVNLTDILTVNQLGPISYWLKVNDIVISGLENSHYAQTTSNKSEIEISELNVHRLLHAQIDHAFRILISFIFLHTPKIL